MVNPALSTMFWLTAACDCFLSWSCLRYRR